MASHGFLGNLMHFVLSIYKTLRTSLRASAQAGVLSVRPFLGCLEEGIVGATCPVRRRWRYDRGEGVPAQPEPPRAGREQLPG